MSETCPKCGEEMHYSNPSWGVTHEPDSIACLRNQLTAAQAENERLRKGLADIKRELGGQSINNGTSTLGRFVDLLLESGRGMKYEWTGDLEDDCTLTVGPYMGRAEALGTLILRDAEFDDEGDISQDYWFCAVYRDRDLLFHSGEHGGFIFGGDMARGICEAIISACTAEAAKAEGETEP